MALDIQYIFSIPFGVIRVVQIALGIIVLICAGAAGRQDLLKGSGFIYFTATGALVTSLVILILFVLHFPQWGIFQRLPWSLIELILSAVWAVFYFISGCLAINTAVSYESCINCGNIVSASGAAGFFTWLTMIVYAVNAFLFFRGWRSASSSTFESRTVTVTTTTQQSSAKY